MKKFIAYLIIVIFLSASCAGKTPNPVQVQQFGDMQKSCPALKAEISSIEKKMSLLLPETDKTGKNIALGIAGWFLIVPWFFMDFSDTEKMELEALRDRLNYLKVLTVEKECK